MPSNYLSKYPEVNKQVLTLETALKRRFIDGNMQFYSCTIATLELLKYIFNNSTFNNLHELKSILLELDLRLNKANPEELSIRILISRVYMMLRDAAIAGNNLNTSSTFSTSDTYNTSITSNTLNNSKNTIENKTILNFDDWHKSITQIIDKNNNSIDDDDDDDDDDETNKHIFDLHSESFDTDPSAVTINKDLIDTMIGFISEIYEDYEISAVKDALTEAFNNNNNNNNDNSNTTCNNIIIEDDDTILVYGNNLLIQHVLVQVAKNRKNLKIVVCENDDGLKLAQHLTSLSFGISGSGNSSSSSSSSNSNSRIDVSLISDAAIYSCMKKMSKVLVAPNIICCDGNAIASAGNDVVVNAAKNYKIPTIAIAPSSAFAPFSSKSNQIQRLLQHLLPPPQVTTYKDKHQEIDIQAYAYTCINVNDLSYIVSNNGGFYPHEMKEFVSRELFSQE